MTYNSDWLAPASWEIIVRTSRRKLWLKPLETLTVSSLDGETEIFEESSDTVNGFKPGIKPMVEDFLADEPSKTLLRFTDQIKDLELYEKILNL